MHRPPGRRVAGEQVREDRLEGTGTLRRRGSLRGHGVEGRGRAALAGVGLPALDGEVDRRAERPDVRGLVRLAAHRGLRRHVARGPGDRPGRGPDHRLGLVVGRPVRRGVRGPEPGDPEVTDLGTAGVEEDVGRLDVAMDDPGPVRGRQRPGELGTELGGTLRRHGSPLADGAGEGWSVDVLHDQPRQAVVVDDVVDGDDVGVVQRGGAARLLPGRPTLCPVLTGEAVDLLEGHLAVEHPVAGEPDGARPATPDRSQELVALGNDPRSGVVGVLSHGTNIVGAADPPEGSSEVVSRAPRGGPCRRPRAAAPGRCCS